MGKHYYSLTCFSSMLADREYVKTPLRKMYFPLNQREIHFSSILTSVEKKAGKGIFLKTGWPLGRGELIAIFLGGKNALLPHNAVYRSRENRSPPPFPVLKKTVFDYGNWHASFTAAFN